MRDYYLVFTLWGSVLGQPDLKVREVLFSTDKDDLPLEDVKKRLREHMQGDNDKLIGITGVIMISSEEAKRRRVDPDEDIAFV